MIRIIISLLISTFAISAFGQTSFTEASDKLANQFVNSGAAMGVVDMNGDGLDDIVRLHRTTQLVIEHQTASGSFENIITGIDTPLSNWSLCIDDVDKNGANDIFLGTANSPHGIVWSDESGKSFNLQILDGPPILPQGSNFADIDNDGDSDIFICNDNGSNITYRNDGGQELIFDPSLAPTNTTIPSDNSGNYASIWVDYDNDDDLDLYISKCRLGIVDVTDPRRINMLWENDGNDNYTEVALQRGLVPYAQSWSTDFADIDNDGDLDVFMINHDTTSRLYENDGTGHYTDITSSANFSPAIDNITVGLQTQFADFDGDTFVDLLITSSQGGYKYFRNNGNKTFGVIFGAFQTLDLMHTVALGDLNNDGFMDVMAGFGMGYNSPTFLSDKLFLNDGNGNNWSKIRLRGTNSNINGIGARLEAHGPWGIMIREVRSGVSYGINSTLTAHFGLGGATSIDSLVIKWPSGYRQLIENPNINETLLIEEGGCINPPTTFLNESICTGEEYLFGGEIISETGIYSRDIYLPEGCDSTIVLDLQVNESYNIQNSFSICEGSIYAFPDGSSQVINADIDYVSTFTSVNSCDSLIMTSLNVLPTYLISANATVCEGTTYTWPDGSSSVILDSQSQTSTLSSQFNCDSIIVTSVNVTTAPNEQFFDGVCSGETYTFPDGNSALIEDEFIYEITFDTGQTCDSTVSYIISALEHYNIVDSDQACLGDNYTFPDGTVFAGLTTSFSWTSHLTASTGCDSTVLINLEVLANVELSESEEVCKGETYTFPDGTSQVITQAFSYVSTLPAPNGCDTLINTSISTKQSYEFTLSEFICSGDDYTFPDGSTQLGITEGVCHNSNFMTHDGCDSIIITKLSPIQPIMSIADILICQGDNYIFPDGSIETDIDEDLEQESTIEASNGCDSIITTFVTVSPSYNVEENFAICIGESIQIGENIVDNITSDSTILINELTSVGCDSIFMFNINVENINPNVSLSAATVSAAAIDVNYQWINCTTNEEIPGATEQNFIPEQDGDYAVILEGVACIVQSECLSILGTSTEDKIFSSNIALFPNPTADKLQLSFGNNAKEIQASIYDVHGKLVHSFASTQSNIEINVAFLAPGVYVTRFETDGKFALKKFVKI